MNLEIGKLSFVCLFLIFLSKSAICQDSINTPPSVSIKYIVFNETNFQEIVDSHDNVLLYFTANWSADSQNKKQNFMNIKDGLLDIKKAEDNRDNFIVVGEVNSKNYKICHDFNIKKYPSIVLISGKRHHLYKGDIEAEQILEWLRQ